VQVGRCGRKRRRCGKGADRGSSFAPTRKGADFLQVSHGENTEQTVNRGSVYNGSPRATGVLGPGYRYGPCAGLSSRGGGLITCILAFPQGALVRLERSAVKVARCVLRGERSREAPDLPGGGPRRRTKRTCHAPETRVV